MYYYPDNGSKLVGGLPLTNFFSLQLQVFLAPLLIFLDQLLDRRLVSTFAGLCQSIIRLRSRSTGLYLSELGSYLLSAAQAPAGTKRISNLLRSPKWSDENITNYLALQAQLHLQQLPPKQQALLVWDESVQEKAESIKSEGLCAVRSSKAYRLLRIKPGYYQPPTKEPVHVPGLRWVGLLLCGLQQAPQLVRFRWWTSRSPQFCSLLQVRLELLEWARELFGRLVLHLFDRGYASENWLGLLLGQHDRFLLRWPSHFKLVDEKAGQKSAYRFSVGRKASSSKQVWDMVRKCFVKRSLLWQKCWHAAYPDRPLTLIICRPGRKGRQPWYLLTNEKVKTDKQAWKLVQAYARRWQIEQSFRFTKSELGMESCRLWFWENKMKLLQIVALVYAFLLTLLEQNLRKKIQSLLRQACHRTGKRCRSTPTPLYRIRLALANLFNQLNFSLIKSSG
jgi:Transposase DDE domain